MKRELTEEQRQKRREAVARYREKNREKLNTIQRERRQTPEAKEKHRTYMAKWRKENPEKQREIQRRNWHKNGDKMNAKQREKYKSDIEYRTKRLQADREYAHKGRRKELYKANRERELERVRKYRTKAKDKIIKYQKEYRDNKRMYLKELWQKYREKNRHLINQKAKIRNRSDIKNVSKNYAKQLIAQRAKKQFGVQLKYSEIPPDVIEIVVNTVKLKRELKNKE